MPPSRYDPKVPMSFEVDDQVRLRKAHPCGGTDWVVYRLGADIGLRCGTCGHRVLVPRRELERRVVRMFRPASHVEGTETATGDEASVAQ